MGWTCTNLTTQHHGRTGAVLRTKGAMLRPATMATTRSRSREGFASINWVEARLAHSHAHRLDVAVGLRAAPVEPGLRRTEPPALQHALDHPGLLHRQGRKVGDGAIPDFAALAHALAQVDRRRRAPIGNDVDFERAPST
jgi:hypothetical protein